MRINQLVPNTILTIFFGTAYCLLIAAPKAKEIKQRADKNHGELQGRSLLFVLLSESALRAGIFLMIGYSIEKLMGDVWYEKYRLDYFFFWLIFVGVIHTCTYYLSHAVFMQKNRPLALFICRLGRNTAYAIIPAYAMVTMVIYFQYREQIELFSGILVQSVFFVSFLIFIFIGIQEAMMNHLVTTEKSRGKPVN